MELLKKSKRVDYKEEVVQVSQHLLNGLVAKMKKNQLNTLLLTLMKVYHATIKIGLLFPTQNYVKKCSLVCASVLIP